MSNPPSNDQWGQQGGWDPNQTGQGYGQQQGSWDPNQTGQGYGQQQGSWNPSQTGQGYGQQGYAPQQQWQGGGGQPPQGQKKSKLPLIIGVGVVVIALIAVAIWGFTRDDDKADETTSATTSQQSNDPTETSEEPTTTEEPTTSEAPTETEEPTTSGQNTGGGGVDDPGKWTSTSYSQVKPVAEFGDGWRTMSTPASTSIMLMYLNDQGQTLIVMVVPVSGESRRRIMQDPIVSGDAVCATSSSGTGAECVIELADGSARFTTRQTPEEAGKTATEFMKAAT